MKENQFARRKRTGMNIKVVFALSLCLATTAVFALPKPQDSGSIVFPGAVSSGGQESDQSDENEEKELELTRAQVSVVKGNLLYGSWFLYTQSHFPSVQF
jgi:hypothetical protein